jgi:hypothetical protein
MPQFHETGYGRKFFDHDLPELTRQIKRVADCLEKQAAPVQSHSEQMIDVMNDEKQAAEFIASVLPGATVAPKTSALHEQSREVHEKLWGIEQTKKDFIAGHDDELRSEPEPAVSYALSEKEWGMVLAEDFFNEALVLVQEFIGQPDGGIAGIHFSGFEDDERGQVKDWHDKSKRRQLILDYLKTEDSYEALYPKDSPITITRYTPEQARKISELEDQGFLENRISIGISIETKVIAVLGVLLPNCGELYISEYADGHFWTQGCGSDEWGTLDQCIKLLKEEFL